MVTEKEVRENLRRRAEYRNRLFNKYVRFECIICGDWFTTVDEIKQHLSDHFKHDNKIYEEIMRGFK